MRALDSFEQDIKNFVAATEGVDKELIVVNDTQATKQLKDFSAEETIILASIPSAQDDSEDRDNVKDIDTFIAFILFNKKPDEIEHANFLDEMKTAQALTADAKEFFYEHLDLDATLKFSAEPVYQAFNSHWHGYRFIISFKTIGYIDDRGYCDS